MLKGFLALFLVQCANSYDFSGFTKIDIWGDDVNLGANVPPKSTLFYKLTGDVATFGAVVAVTDKWFSVGTSSSGGMIGADLAIFLPRDDGYTVGDYWSSAFATPKLDDKQNIKLLESSTSSGETTVVWERPVVSCDMDEDLNLMSFPTVMFAIGGSGDLQYHQHRVVFSVDWLGGEAAAVAESKLEADATKHTFVPPVDIVVKPGLKTQYQCISLEANLTEDSHGVKFEPVITSKLVHHMLFFGCKGEVTEYQGQSVVTNEPFECGVMPPTAAGGCTSLRAWAVGRTTEYLNEEFGEFVSKDITHFVIQYHFDNPNLQGGVDRSGTSIYLTPTLRPNTLAQTIISVPGALQSGEIEIPPNEPSFELTSELPSLCSSRMTRDEVKIVEVGFHMHGLGTHAYIEHWRDGARLPDVAWQHWDFNFQNSQRFSKDRWVTFKRGDTLRLHCVYDTTSKTEVTRGGDGTDDEMCIAFLRVFPRSGIQAAFNVDNTLKLARAGDDKMVCVPDSVQFGQLQKDSSLTQKMAMMRTMLANTAPKDLVNVPSPNRYSGNVAECTLDDLQTTDHSLRTTIPSGGDDDSESSIIPESNDNSDPPTTTEDSPTSENAASSMKTPPPTTTTTTTPSVYSGDDDSESSIIPESDDNSDPPRTEDLLGGNAASSMKTPPPFIVLVVVLAASYLPSHFL